MNALTQFFAMGGYALYVWGAYSVTFALVAIEVGVLVRRCHRRARPVERPRAPVRPQWRRST